ncbi:MAG: cupredoxin domain-containing protein [Solirubrobacterales bacterium]
MTAPSPLALLLTCASLAGGAIVAGCGGDEEPSAATATGGAEIDRKAAGSTDEVEIADFKFAPETVAVRAGTRLTWTNGDEAPHTATADDGSFDTGTLKLDDSGTITLDRSGTYSYYCRFHPFMKATVEVG